MKLNLKSQLISVVSTEQAAEVAGRIAAADMEGRESIKVGYLMRLIGAHGEAREKAEAAIRRELDDRGIRAI